ncbi:MAG: hypothetical protein NC079_00495 [Clostridium sp.]|nr:hypothetical protein [Acetatifactor muris]MCM1527485.1 hypothetical protein [Bacteroides sp.]MCM1562071.1 hypothetical protein [Clostridium sp.]
MKTNRKKRIIRFLIGFPVLAAIAVGGALGITRMVCTGAVIPNNFYISETDITGCDVSRYQGAIQWDVLSCQDISFAFIKATEGSSHVDPNFSQNWEQAFQTDLLVGAYHFFSFESPGESQAAHFTQTVPLKKNMLPPVVDIEFYGNYNAQNTNSSDVREELDAFLLTAEEFYGTKPIIYTTLEAYDHFLKGSYEEYPLWIRSVLTPPRIDREWDFWQYTNRGQLPGYSGPERYIDLNMFRGDMNMLQEMLIR